MSKYKIEDGIEIPSEIQPGRGPKYPFDSMKVGQSFAIPIAEFCSASSARTSVMAAANRYVKGKAKKFISRKTGDFIRVWRTE